MENELREKSMYLINTHDIADGVQFHVTSVQEADRNTGSWSLTINHNAISIYRV